MKSIAGPFCRGAALCALALTISLARAAAPPGPNPYQVERSWPDYFLQHQKLFTQQAGEPAPAGDGDSKALQRLLGYLDLEQPGFYMHVR